jgi:hypoxanthine phosphoribosyltransferase
LTTAFSQDVQAMRVLLTEEQIREGVKKLARQIDSDYDGRPLTIVSVLTGSLVFLADLIRLLRAPLRVGVVQAASYRGAGTDPKPLLINKELLPDIRGRHVLLLDDIFDTGKTIVGLIDQLQALQPASIRVAVLLRKEGRQKVQFKPDYCGFAIPNEFVVGYGLDYNDENRNLPYLAALDETELGSAEPKQKPTGTD